MAERKKFNELNSVGSLGGNEEFVVVTDTETKKASINQIKTFINSEALGVDLGNINQSIKPVSNNSYNLGSEEKKWRNIYANTIYATNTIYANTIYEGGKSLSNKYSPTLKAGSNIALVPGTDGTITISSTATASSNISVINNLKSTSTGAALSANQGRILNETKADKEEVNNKIPIRRLDYNQILKTSEIYSPKGPNKYKISIDWVGENINADNYIDKNNQRIVLLYLDEKDTTTPPPGINYYIPQNSFYIFAAISSTDLEKLLVEDTPDETNTDAPPRVIFAYPIFDGYLLYNNVEETENAYWASYSDNDKEYLISAKNDIILVNTYNPSENSILYCYNNGKLTAASGEGSSDTNITVVDSLESKSTTEALSANQGYVLNNNKANKATTLSGYGITNAYTKDDVYTKTEVNNLSIRRLDYNQILKTSEIYSPNGNDSIKITINWQKGYFKNDSLEKEYQRIILLHLDDEDNGGVTTPLPSDNYYQGGKYIFAAISLEDLNSILDNSGTSTSTGQPTIKQIYAYPIFDDYLLYNDVNVASGEVLGDEWPNFNDDDEEYLISAKNDIILVNTYNPSKNSILYCYNNGKLTAIGNGGLTVTNSLTSTSTAEALSAYQGKVLNEKFSKYYTKTEVNDLLDDISGGSDITVINSLTSTSTTNALSAYQGKYLNDNKANKATTLSGYGITNAYTKTEVDGKIPTVENSLTSTSTTKALSAYQGKVLDERISALENYHTTTTTTAATQGSSTTSTPSDATLKNIISDVYLSPEQISSAPSVKFTWKYGGMRENVGTIAQYWKEVLPEVVKGEEGNYSMDYGAASMISVISLAKKVIEQNSKIQELKMEIEELKALIKNK